MGSVHKLRPPSSADVSRAGARAAELGDALRCIDRLIGPDEEQLQLLSNDIRGLMRLLSREADAISQQLELQV